MIDKFKKKSNKKNTNSIIKKWPTQIGVGYCKITPRQKRYVKNVLDSNRITYGPITQELEQEFAKIHRRKFAIFCNSGTSALSIALSALKEIYKWRDGDEVIIPAINFVSDVNVLLHHNLKPVFVDVDARFYTIDPNKIERAITTKTRGIIPMHAFGFPCEMNSIMNIARKYDLRIIEDCCESGFVLYKKRPVGSFGDLACFSTYQAHIITTGVGGLILTDNKILYPVMRSLINHGRDDIYIKIDDDRGEDRHKMQVVSRRFNFVRPGYSFRLTEMEAALGLATLHDSVGTIIKKRNRIANYFSSHLKKYGNYLQLPEIPFKSNHAFMMFPIVARGKEFTRDELVFFLETRNIETRYMLPLLSQPYIKKRFGDLSKKYPVAESIEKNGFYIGCHEHISDNEIAFILSVFDDFFTSKHIFPNIRPTA